jgi:hypothetical protein
MSLYLAYDKILDQVIKEFLPFWQIVYKYLIFVYKSKLLTAPFIVKGLFS